MKMSNEELVSAYDEAYDNIQLAISTLDGIDEYKEVYETLEQAKYELEETAETYMQAFNRECETELEYQNLEYERSKI